MVQMESWMLLNEKNELSDTPVTTPGRASGSTSKNETASRPKNWN